MNAPASEPSQLSPVKRAFLKLEELQGELDEVKRRSREPIAIVGLGCRFPGGASDPESYWRLLRNGHDAIEQVPDGRWDSPDHRCEETARDCGIRWGGFLDQIDHFDPQLFGISPREAHAMDPQQRLFLEVSWEALEHAGHSPRQLEGSKTGVFVGVCTSDYENIQLKWNDTSRMDGYFASGIGHSIVSGRLSYTLGLLGPTLTIDTACSSSLVAVHLACASLRSGECRMAIAGGVNAILSPDIGIALAQSGMMSADGRCKTFDASADGYVRGEGCGVVVVKRLSTAIEDGDRILALIRGSAINHDGPSSGLTVPNGPSQARVIRQALESGSITPAEVGYVEAHGTGTSLGDPIEVQTLAAVYGEKRPADEPLRIGSVKTNFGHLEAAAGIAGLIKIVLSLQHQEIFPSLHFHHPNPHISWETLPVDVPTGMSPWVANEGARLAAVSSFGFSGTNAHLVLQEPPSTPSPEVHHERPSHLMKLSARSASSLKRLAQRYADRLAEDSAGSLPDLCFTANTGRAEFSHRTAIVAQSRSELQKRLMSLAGSPAEVPSDVHELRTVDAPPIAFLFSGQGSQYLGMGSELYRSQPVFRDALDRCEALLEGYLSDPLTTLLFSPSERNDTASRLDETSVTQPALFSLEYALAAMWRSWGVQPSIVMGHSVGEYVAACVAGLFRLEDALRLVAERGRLMQRLCSPGRMAVVSADEQRVQRAIQAFDGVSIAALNGPQNTVISGQGGTIEQVVRQLQAEDISAQALNVSHAFHSEMMDPMLDAFEAILSTVSFGRPQLTLVSNLTGQVCDGDEMASPAYWLRHVRHSVQFARSMDTVAALDYHHFVEIGPHTTLLAMGQQCVRPENASWLPSLRRGVHGWTQSLRSLATLFTQGVSVQWSKVDAGFSRQRVSLPTHPFERKRYWCTAPKRVHTPQIHGVDDDSHPNHPLLDQCIRSPLWKESVFQVQVSLARMPELSEHCFHDQAVIPAAVLLEMALGAGMHLSLNAPLAANDFNILEPLVLPDDDPCTVQIMLKAADGGTQEFRVISLDKHDRDVWREHACGTLDTSVADDDTDDRGEMGGSKTGATGGLEGLRAACDHEVAIADFYEWIEASGFRLGDAFRNLVDLRNGPDQALGHIRLQGASTVGGDGKGCYMHPVLLDSCMQVFGAALYGGSAIDDETTYMPVGFDHFRIERPAHSEVWSHVRLHPYSDAKPEWITGDILILDAHGQRIGQILGLRFKRTQAAAIQPTTTGQLASLLYQVKWSLQSEEPILTQERVDGSWLILADKGGLGQRLAVSLQELGQEAKLVCRGDACHDGSLRVDLQQPGDFLRAVRDWSTRATVPLCGVVNLWPLDAAAEEPEEVDAAELGCRSTLYLLQALESTELPSPPGLWLVTRGSQFADVACRSSVAQAPAWGLAGAITTEHPEFNCRCIDLDPAPSDNEHLQLQQELLAFDEEDRVSYRGGDRYVARLVRNQQFLTTSASVGNGHGSPESLEIQTPGVLESLTWRAAKRPQPGPHEVEVQVTATGLMFRDVLVAMGMYPEQIVTLGGECAGSIVSVGSQVTRFAVGDEVMALTPHSFDSYCLAHEELVVKKPRELNDAGAATILNAYLTAYYGLCELAEMKKGDRVLIQAAAGGVGMAAVKLAQHVGAEVFATAGSPVKRRYLRDALGVKHVYDSRTLSFGEEVAAATQGQGVDIVLNSLIGDAIPASLRATASNARFIELGKREVWGQEQVHALRPDVTIFPIDLAGRCLREPETIGPMLRRLLQMIQEGDLTPLPHHVFASEKVEDAFRFMAQAKHIGKVVVVRDAPIATPSLEERSLDSYTMRPDATYLITGGLGALGLEVASWMVDQGVRSLVLVGRHGPAAEARARLDELRGAGCQVETATVDVTCRAEVQQLLCGINDRLPPLRGVIHAAAALDDGILQQQSWQQFQRVLAPKVAGTWNLHLATKELPLDFFVMFSSVTSLLGGGGLGNYAAANAYLDAFAHYRRQLGLPALTINWGAWSEVGLAARQVVRARASQQGLKPMPRSHGLQLLPSLFASSEAQVAVMDMDWSRYLSGVKRPFLAGLGITEAAATPASNMRDKLEQVTANKRGQLLASHVRQLVAKVLALDSDQPVDDRQPLKELGLDSLMAVELRNLLTDTLRLERALPATVAFDYPSVSELCEFLVERVLGWTSEPTAAVQGPEGASLDRIEQLSDEEIDQMLSKKMLSGKR